MCIKNYAANFSPYRNMCAKFEAKWIIFGTVIQETQTGTQIGIRSQNTFQISTRRPH